MRPVLLLILGLLTLSHGCSSTAQRPQSTSEHATPAVASQLPTVYLSSDGMDGIYVRGNRVWKGTAGELAVAPLNEAGAAVVYSRAPDAACVGFDEVQLFGVPDRLRKGVRFRCGTAQFEVIDCDNPENCDNALILAFWRTGVAPGYNQLPVNYYYNRCRGIQSITFSLDRPVRVGFGEALELREGLGLLAQPNSPACGRDSAVMTSHAAPALAGQAGHTADDLSACLPATISDLARSPENYRGQRVCTQGFLGRIVSAGEDSPKLYATREEAQRTFADAQIDLDIPFDLQTQERLSRFSTQPLRVEGTFDFDSQCWPRRGRNEPDYHCFPLYPMRMGDAHLIFNDGSRFSFSDPGSRAPN
jgi:hypothetical protein